MKKRRRLIIAFVAAVFFLLIFANCKTRIQYVPVESVKTENNDTHVKDSLNIIDILNVKDSISVRDSIVYKYNHKGEVILKEVYNWKEKYFYSDKSLRNLQFKYDSLANVKQNIIPVPYPVSGKTEYKYPKWLVVLSVIGAFSVGFGIYRFYIRFR